MRSLKLGVLIGLVLSLASAAGLAGEEFSLPKTQAGMGVSVGGGTLYIGDGSSSALPLSFSNFYIPLIFSKQFKLEPEIGYLRIGSSSGDAEMASSNFRLGTGLYYLHLSGRVALQFGIRFGISMFTTSVDIGSGSDSNSKTDFYIGPAVGAEYFFSEQFSLGAELQLNYLALGDYEDDGGSEYMFSNETHFFVRFYFLSGQAEDPAPAPVHRQPVEKAKPEPAPAVKKPPVEEKPAEPPSGGEEEPPVERAGIETPDCPAGAEKLGKAPPQGYEQYCVLRGDSGETIREGWFMSWFDNRQLASQGQYRAGKKQGRWTYFYKTGKKRLEAEYLDDQKHGSWVYWSRDGQKQREVKFQNGVEIE